MSTNNRQTWDTRSPLAAEVVQAMGMSQAKDYAADIPEYNKQGEAVMDGLRQAIEAVWALGYDDPAKVVDDVHDEAKRWLRGFTDLCHCNRPPRECVCP